MKTFSIKTRVYVEDTDFGGVVYHANYLKFMERARSEWLIHHAESLVEWAERGYVFVVRQLNIEYVKPAKLHDILEITAEISYIGNSSITFTQVIKLANDPSIVFTNASVQVVCINKNSLRPTPIPQTLRELKHG